MVLLCNRGPGLLLYLSRFSMRYSTGTAAMAAGPGAIGMALPYKKSGVVDRSLSRGEEHLAAWQVPQCIQALRCTGEGEVKELGWSLVVQTLVRPTIQLPWPSSSSFRVL